MGGSRVGRMRIGLHAVVSIAHITHTLGSTFLLADCDPSETLKPKSKTDPRVGLHPILCSKSSAVVFLERGKRFLKGSVLDLKGWGNDLKLPLKCRNWFKSGLTLNQFIQRMKNITLAKLIQLIAKNVINRVVKKKKIYSRRGVEKKHFFQHTHQIIQMSLF